LKSFQYVLGIRDNLDKDSMSSEVESSTIGLLVSFVIRPFPALHFTRLPSQSMGNSWSRGCIRYRSDSAAGLTTCKCVDKWRSTVPIDQLWATRWYSFLGIQLKNGIRLGDEKQIISVENWKLSKPSARREALLRNRKRNEGTSLDMQTSVGRQKVVSLEAWGVKLLSETEAANVNSSWKY